MDRIKSLDNLQNSQQDMLDFVIETASINSGSFNAEGVKQVAEKIHHHFQSLDCHSEFLPCEAMPWLDDNGQQQHLPMGPILRFQQRPEAARQVLLVGHMDTVFPKEDPFQEVQQKDNILYGPGVTDMKGGIAVILFALRQFEQFTDKDKLGWEVLLTSDEEIGSFGSGPLLAERAKHHHYGLVFEPSIDEEGTLAYARKGSGKFTLVVHGRAAHVGRQFDEGRSAIVKMAELIEKINALNGQQENVVINFGKIHGGTAVNVVPDLCVCRLDIRLKNSEEEQWVNNHLSDIINQANHQPNQVECHGGFKRKPKQISPENANLFEWVKQVGAELGQTLSWRDTGGCCDGNNLAHAGLPNVDTLGVRGGKIHSDQEYMIIDSLVERAQLTAALLMHLTKV